MHRIPKLISVIALFFGHHAAEAALTKLHVPDAGIIEFMIDNSNRVYLRNLNAIDGTWQGCCFAYWIDLSTDFGKSQLSNFLSAKFTRGPIDIWVEKNGGAVVGTGNF